ncbi:MAG: NADH-quinone oxidoreductase subunit NuoE [Actinomycetaceae bacterium]|nr:NADH-quinone oxidoreductase subunit NuoE [Actinomycetaceae bacterium]MDU0970815.1 NADH-quinone oxidoreductase subunit NuoE [Actinomycetaceae bacterium]
MSFYPTDVEERLRDEAAQIVSRYPTGHERSALLPMLHLVQSEDGYVSANGIGLCADILGISRAEVSAVATFYTQYKRRPNGTYTVGVCTNAMCAVMGGDSIFEALEHKLGIGHEETTPDGKITLEALECNAACDYAPVIMVNWEFFDNQTPASALQMVEDIQADRPIKPTRGPDKVPTFKEASHILAGFPDLESANQGIGAGEPTLWGLKVANQRGMTADGKVAALTSGQTNSGEAEEAGTKRVGHAQSSAERKSKEGAK